MKNLKENEMVTVSGGKVNWDAWEDGYNCMMCRVKAGAVITRNFIASLLFTFGNPLTIIAGAISECSAIQNGAEAIGYCQACWHEVFE